MRGPGSIIRGKMVDGLEFVGPLHEWTEDRAYLLLDLVEYRGRKGAVFTYYNPPVHQMGNPALDAFLQGFESLGGHDIEFLLLYLGCDPVHAGGDLKESLSKLKATKEKKKELEAAGASEKEIDELFKWGDARLEKGFKLYKAVRDVSKRTVTVAICGGGTRFGGSAEVALMADYLVGDSRSAMCFSEAMIGLIPGWGGVGRAYTKSGEANARYMAMACPVVKAKDLLRAGIYDRVLQVDEPLPRRQKTGHPERDEQEYVKSLQTNEERVGPGLLSAGLELAMERPGHGNGADKEILCDLAEVSKEVKRRSDPNTYKHLWGKSLRDVKDEIAELGRPLAPQSIEQLERLFATASETGFDEEVFVRSEVSADARLYRHPRFEEGILATLEQRVADFREEGDK